MDREKLSKQEVFDDITRVLKMYPNIEQKRPLHMDFNDWKFYRKAKNKVLEKRLKKGKLISSGEVPYVNRRKKN